MTRQDPTGAARRVTVRPTRLTERRPLTTRSVYRPIRTTPPLRPADQAFGPTRREVLTLWEELDLWSCAYCDASAGPMVVLEVDHIHPLAKGGVHEWSNLAPACRECNRAKADASPEEWSTVLAGMVCADGAAPDA
ncbi:HNH endonuclease [Streptomyces sp. NPDC048603]|uniref:HNH endonuclease n=1 Tax=Streptomyces sp. NPDC048603 TaxID=3365577 RepID=UPI003719EAB5